jgi:hypothetical protein
MSREIFMGKDLLNQELKRLKGINNLEVAHEEV